METKKEIRTRILKERKELTVEAQHIKSNVICKKLLLYRLYLSASEIYCYVNNEEEVNTTLIIEDAWKSGKKVAVPRVNGETMDFFYIQSFSDLKLGNFGILEPTTTQIAQAEKALVIMPGVAFDKQCSRIGYGKGYYDRYLELHQNYRRVALAFDLQCIAHIPADPFDIKPEIILTEGHAYEEETLFTS